VLPLGEVDRGTDRDGGNSHPTTMGHGTAARPGPCG
jgi:hypothetical protein